MSKNIRDILKKIGSDKKPVRAEPWRVQIHIPVEDILELIQQRRQREMPDYPFPDYQQTKHFMTFEEAQKYLFLIRLRGVRADIVNNHTGEVYDQE
jgi:hypothetical protein